MATQSGAIDQAAEIRPPHQGTPVDEATRAIEEARRLLAEAAAAVTSGDAAQLARALEVAAASTDLLARALWFLHRAERESAAPPAAR